MNRDAAVTAMPAGPANKPLAIGLWIAQILLALMYAMAGLMKTFLSVPELVANGINFAPDVPLLAPALYRYQRARGSHRRRSAGACSCPAAADAACRAWPHSHPVARHRLSCRTR